MPDIDIPEPPRSFNVDLTGRDTTSYETFLYARAEFIRYVMWIEAYEAKYHTGRWLLN